MNNKSFTVKPTNLDQTIKTIIESIDKGYELQNIDESSISNETRLEYNDSLIFGVYSGH